MATPSSPPPPLLPSQDPPQYQHQPPSSPSSTPSDPSSPKATPTLESTSPPKKTLPLPWTHQETINLIQAYQDKWYSLKKGQLKASQWEEVAITVAARCGYDEPSKSSTQCRHKIEKLRKRYRAEKLKPNPNSWQYFDLMDRMERGPLPISARPMAMIHYQNSDSSENEDSDGEELSVRYSNDSKKNKSKSINHIVRGEPSINRSAMDPKFGGGSDRVLGVLRNPMVRKRKECFETDDDNNNDNDEEDEDEDGDDDEEREGEGRGREVALELAAEIRAFAERFVRTENKKIEMMKETESYRMEMENKQREMILESQRKIVDTIGRVFSSNKKMKMAQEI